MPYAQPGTIVKPMEIALVEKLELAKQNKRVLNALILEYTPFIKKSAAFVFFNIQQRHDALTEANAGLCPCG
jgi:hypothetical protein